MSRVIPLFLSVCVTVLMLAGPAWCDVSLWALANPDVATARVGWTQDRFEVGLSGGYMDDLRPDDIEAYRVGTYALWIVNPDAQFPIRGLIPGDVQWLPETIPVQFYIGALLDFEFQDHKLMPALVGGGMVDTKAFGSLGVEVGKTFSSADWDKLADNTQGWGAVLFIRGVFGKPGVSASDSGV